MPESDKANVWFPIGVYDMKLCIHFGLIDVFFSIYSITLIGLNHVHMYSRLSISYDFYQLFHSVNDIMNIKNIS